MATTPPGERARFLAGLLALVLLPACGKTGQAPAPDCGEAASCMAQAVSLLKGGVDTKSQEVRVQAAALFQKGCDLGAAASCRELGIWLEDSDLAPRDLPRAAGLYRRGCALKDAAACGYLGLLYYDGRGVPYDPAQALKYRDIACGLGDGPTRETFYCKK
jgi:TPR repeat protein